MKKNCTKNKQQRAAFLLAPKLHSVFLRTTEDNICGQKSVVEYNAEGVRRGWNVPILAGDAFFISLPLTSVKNNPLTVKSFVTHTTSQKLAVRHSQALQVKVHPSECTPENTD